MVGVLDLSSLEQALMNKTLISTALLALLGASVMPAFAQPAHGAHHGGASMPSPAAAKLAEGVVKKIDKTAGKLTIAHGPLEALGMPAMTMMFSAARPAELEALKVGDKVRFAVDKVDGVLTVTSIEAVR